MTKMISKLPDMMSLDAFLEQKTKGKNCKESSYLV
jgi:hypothetical protein